MNEKENKTFADVIVELRKEKGMTQQELADKLHITDKAVSKWERGLSYPDITSISKLANILGVESSYLIDICKKEDSDNPYLKKINIQQITNLIFTCVGISMGIAVVVLSTLNKLQIKDAITMLGIGLACISISSLQNNREDTRNFKK